MGLELQRALQDCMAAAERLAGLLEEDRQDMPGCVGGEILLEYQRGTERALRTVQELRSSLYKLLAMD